MVSQVVNYGDARLPERFWSKVVPEPNSGCWLWTAANDGHGYGAFGLATKRVIKAHRVSYEALVGLVPNGLEIDHRCRVRCCVNPMHLEAVTRSENVRRGLQGVLCPKPEVCHRGHPMSGENAYLTKRGSVVCRACSRIARRKYQERAVRP